MKKLCSLLFVLCFMFSLSACGGNETASYCVECGEEIYSTYKFCSSCGVPINKISSTDATDNDTTQNNTNSVDSTNAPSTPTHTHSYSAATCTAPGTCTCGATSGSELGHEWVSATCETAQTCKTCGATRGSELGHEWVSATCETAQTCKTCGATRGSELGHEWVSATCETAQTCKTCGATSGSKLGHEWEYATCETAQTCKTCGVSEGSANGHWWDYATLLKPKTCAICEKTDGDVLSAVGIYDGEPYTYLAGDYIKEAKHTIYLDEDGSYRLTSSRSTGETLGTWERQGDKIIVIYFNYLGEECTETFWLLEDGFMSGTDYYEKIA